MPIPAQVRADADEPLAEYCVARIPEHVRDQIRLSHSIRGNAITLLEHRPPWDQSDGPWTDMKIAKIQWDPSTATWHLFWADSHGRWLRLDDVPPVGDVALALRTIDQNPHGCFWG